MIMLGLANDPIILVNVIYKQIMTSTFKGKALDDIQLNKTELHGFL